MHASDKILVTGAAGMIGSALVWELNRRGFENIIITDVLGTDEKWKNLVALRYANYLSAAQLLGRLETEELSDVKWVFHLGACSATTEKDADYLMENNFQYTQRLAEWALAGGRRFVYASSAATYGDGEMGMDDSSEDLEKYRPLNMYGYSKHLFDLHAKRRGWLDKIVGLKYFNVFGPNEDHKGDMRSVVHKASSQIRDTGKVQLFKSYHPDYPDGGQKRDFVYVKDAVAMTLHLAANTDAAGLFNVGTGKASTWVELVTPIFKTLGKPVEIEFIEMPDVLKGKYQYYTCADTAHLDASGWQGPMHSLDEAVGDYVKNYLVPGTRLGEKSGH
ncbi:MAG: ADP-glyceromanno-heptose 6-epimerase [Akkermansiaceae bacterium]|jgi:ADP-L-glycero-D-manno-heptose 6-epimerase|nr:ADP-glyceromanno-heptose 6-epimerase [Akkermansiaceae bacterium]MDP4645963.1 ADP-glyceromanno-heptose 6-epimerase [Akkermansiaceae bacterium]MDP4721831.1 ADP-glyceromanno-heptose 6-epimerase [Akkermansiaceae bacterium]MDP4781173.1 ADP-glyceromanno-heptose 6-epimerase [Akkermansiaceae bacterium]MDP4846520.1 ADP-glyceromanno-heptose 6-epimerase [Akkermansiaceae bacterium]